VLTGCRYLALVYAIALAISEAVLNSIQAQWQYAPMWVIDYLIVVYLLIGFWATRRGRGVPVLMSAYALSAGVLYMAFFANFDPDLPDSARGPGFVVALIGLALGVSVFGLVGTTAAWARQERAAASGGG
jgi:hypothetical protein